MQVSRIPSPGPPNSLGTPKFMRPAAKAFSQMSRGKISLSSYSRARGIISCSLNFRASALSSDCSAVRSKPIIGMLHWARCREDVEKTGYQRRLRMLNRPYDRFPARRVVLPGHYRAARCLEKAGRGGYDASKPSGGPDG